MSQGDRVVWTAPCPTCTADAEWAASHGLANRGPDYAIDCPDCEEAA